MHADYCLQTAQCSHLRPPAPPLRVWTHHQTLIQASPLLKYVAHRRAEQILLAAEHRHAQLRVICSASAESAALPPFHLAFPVRDIAEARQFYGRHLGCPEGRSAARWVDYNFYGHQIVCHLVDGYSASSSANAVDGDPVPVPHFGLALSVDEFHALAERVRAAGIKFIIEPHIRFQGAPGEQWTMFFKDPSGNSLEFKAMTNPANLFAKYNVDE